MLTHQRLAADHTPEAVRARLASGPAQSYRRDIVFGAIDGTVTTFAVMLREEHGLPDGGRSAVCAGVSTFVAFMLVGAVLLLVFVVELLSPGLVPSPIVWSAAMAAAAFFTTGVAKAYVVRERWLRSGLETLALGGGAALLAYAVGLAFRGLAAGG